MGSSPNCTLKPSNRFEWRKTVFETVTSMGIRHAKAQTLRGKAFNETRAEFLQSSLKTWDAPTITGFCAKASSHPISTHINRWQGLQVIQDLAILQAFQELFDPEA
ncbi:hypothetical protein Tco_0777412 [Tanacetum coccineum]